MPAGFLDPFDVRPLANGKDWMVLREVRYVTRTGRVIYIPATFVTDFGSIPKLFRWLFQPATGKHRLAAGVHDWIYRTADVNFTKEEADLIFLEIMEISGVPKWKRVALYQAVKWGGGSSFVERSA